MGWPTNTTHVLCESDIESWTDASQGNTRWGATWAANSSASNTNTITWVEDPADANGATVVCVTKERTGGSGSLGTSTGDRTGWRNNLDRCLHGSESGVAACRAADEVVFQRSFYWTKQVSAATWTGGLCLIHLSNAGTNTLRIGIQSGTGLISYILGTGSTWVSTGQSVAESTWTNLTVRYVKSTGSDGILEIWLGDTKVVNVTNHTTTTAVSGTSGGFFFDHQVFGTINFAHTPVRVYCKHFAIIDPLLWAHASIYNQTPSVVAALANKPWAGVGLGEVTGSSFTVLHCQPAGGWRYDWRAADLEVALEYSTASDLSGSTTTAYVSAPAADRWVAHLTATGLTAGTVYYYRIKARDATVPGTVDNGPIRQTRTMSATGTHKIGAVHCTDQAGSPFYYAETWIDEEVDFANHGGDYIYNDSSYSATGPHAELLGFIREYTMPLHDMSLLRYLHTRNMVVQASDHDFAEDGVNNSVLGGYQKGYTDSYGVNATGADGTAYAAADTCQNSYLAALSGVRGAAVTVPTLWDAGRQAWWKFIRRGQPSCTRFAASPPANAWEDTEEFARINAGGNAHFLWLGSREWQDWGASPGYPEAYNGTGSPCMFGDAFEQWFQEQLDALALLSPGVLTIFADSTFGAYNSVDDNFEQVATGQRKRLLDAIKNTLGSAWKVVWIAGDRHWREFDNGQRFKDGLLTGTTAANDYSGVMLAEILPGNGSKGILGQGLTLAEIAAVPDSTQGIVKSDGAGVTRSPVNWSRFGCIVTVQAGAKSVQADFYTYAGSTALPEADESIQASSTNVDESARGRGRGTFRRL